MVKIKTKDELCCARAIMTMKAYYDFESQPADYDSLPKGRLIKSRVE